jgi:hypothetical protein
MGEGVAMPLVGVGTVGVVLEVDVRVGGVHPGTLVQT